MNTLTISGKNVNSDIVKGLKSFGLSIARNSEDNTIDKIVTTEVTVRGDTAQLIKETFFDDCTNVDKELDATFKSDICDGLTANVKIGSDTVQYCPKKCEAKINLKSEDEEDACYQKLKNNYWWEGLQDQYDFPIMYHSNQTYLSFFVLILRQLLYIVLLYFLCDLFAPDIPFVPRIVEVLACIALGGTFLNRIPLVNDILEQLDNWATGAGKWTPIVYYRDIFEYQARTCGLTFQSSILNDPSSSYYNMFIWSYQSSSHGDKDDTSAAKRLKVFKDNAPLRTTIQLLESIKTYFNADYRIINGTLYFEEVDFFKNIANNKVADLVELTNRGVADPCYEFDIQELCAYLEATYAYDSVDIEGNKMLGSTDTSEYRDRMDFNDPPSDSQKGVCFAGSEDYGAARFMFDRVSLERNGLLDLDRVMDRFRNGGDGYLGAVFGNQGITRDFDLIVAAGAQKFKMLVAEPNADPNDVAVIKKQIGREGGENFYAFNYPLFFQVNLPETLGENELINNFLYKLNPRGKSDNLKINSVTTTCNCDIVSSALEDFDSIYVNTHFGKGFPEKVDFTVEASSVSVSIDDIKIDCRL